MAKKIVRGITDIKTITNQDFDTNNVNDLLSDGKNNYIHRKKQDGSEEYHNLTDNIKTVTSDNTDLLDVTNNNTTNSATFHPKHDNAKEQTLESTRGTVTIQHAENGTSGTTKVDTNPQQVLEHNNLKTGDGLSTLFNNNQTTVVINTTNKPSGTDLNSLSEGMIFGKSFPSEQTPSGNVQNVASYITLKTDSNKKLQFYIRESALTKGLIVMAYRFINNGIGSEWRNMSVDFESLTTLLSQKQNKLENNTSIGVSGSGLRQLYSLKQTYNVTGGLLKTHVKSISENTNINTAEEEFNFIVKINKGASSVNFTLNSHDSTKFQNIITTYGANNAVNINGCVFTLSGSTLTVSTTNNTAQNYVITFSDII